MLFFCLVEGLDGRFEELVVDLALGEGKEAGEGVGEDGERFSAVGKGLFLVVHLS